MNLNKVDKNIPIPIYYQLKSIIRNKIEKNEWKPPDKMSWFSGKWSNADFS